METTNHARSRRSAPKQLIRENKESDRPNVDPSPWRGKPLYASNTGSSVTKEVIRDHPRHTERLIRLMLEGNPFKCSGCKELGFGPRYRCAKDRCHFVLHEECAKARPTDRFKTHPFMADCRFKLLWEPPGGPTTRYCDACGREVQGFLYHAPSDNLDLHPCCVNLTSNMRDPHGRISLFLTDRAPAECVKCERKKVEAVRSKNLFRGWSYVSSCGKYCYHVDCVKKLTLDKWESGSFYVASSTSSSHWGGSGLIRSDIVSSSRSSSSVTSATRPGTTGALIETANIGISILSSALLGIPVPMLTHHAPMFTHIVKALRN